MKILNLDKDFNSVLNLIYEEDIRDISPRISLTTKLDEAYDFKDDLIQLMGTQFRSHSGKTINMGSGLAFVVYARPDKLTEVIDTLYEDSRGLASAFGGVVTDDSVNESFEFTYYGLNLATLLYRLRQDSFERCWEQYKHIIWLYLDGKGLHSSNLGTISSSAPISIPGNGSFQINYCSIQDDQHSLYEQSDFPNAQKFSPFWEYIMRDKVEIKGVNYGVLGQNYSLNLGDPALDNQTYTLVYQKYDSKNRAQPWTLTFAKLDVTEIFKNNLCNKSGSSLNLTW